jgi:hypothetical protein
MTTIEDRVTRLEREARRWRRFGLTSLLVGVLVIAGGAAVPIVQISVLSAKSFQMVDDAGRKRLEMKLEGGQPMVRMFTANGKAKLAFGISSRGEPSYQVLDQAGRVNGRFGTTPNGTEVTILDAQGRVRAEYGLENDEPNLRLHNPHRNEHIDLFIDGTSGPELLLQSSDGSVWMPQ